jgi:hypothetical protein
MNDNWKTNLSLHKLQKHMCWGGITPLILGIGTC